MMRKLLCALIVLVCIIPFMYPKQCHAALARQLINGSDQNYGDTGNPSANGAEFMTNNTLTTTADGQNFAAAAPSILVDSPGIGILTIFGDTIISGNVGNAANSLGLLNANGVSGKNLELQGNSYITRLNFGDDGKVTISGGKDFTGNITTSDGIGTLTFKGNSNSNFTGEVGAAGASLNKINVNGAFGKIVNFSGNVYANILDFGDDATVTMADGKILTGKVTTSTDGKGGLSFTGEGGVTGQVGTSNKKLREIRGGAVGLGGSITTFSSDVYSVLTTVIGTGTMAFGGDLRGTTLDFAADGKATLADGQTITTDVTASAGTGNGTLSLLGDATVKGKLGTAAVLLKQVGVDGAGKTVAFAETIHATALNFGADGTATIANNKNVDAAVTTSTNNTGTLTLLGDSNVTADIGAAGMALKQVNADGVGTNVYFKGDTYASTINFGGDGTVTVKSSKDITGNITTSADNTGTLALEGRTTINGNIGAAGQTLALVDTGLDNSSKTVKINGNVFATTLNFQDNGTVRIGDGFNLNAMVTTGADGNGTLRFDGATTTGGNIGAVGAALAEVHFHGVTSLGHDIAAYLTTVNAGGTVNLSKNVSIDGDLTNSGILNVGANTLALNAGTPSGNYTQKAGSSFDVTLNGASSGQLNAIGTANIIGGGVTVTPSGVIQNGATYNIMTAAGGLLGTAFDPVTCQSQVLTFTLDTTSVANTVQLIAARSTFGSVGGISDGVMAAAIDAAVPSATGNLADFIDYLDTASASEINSALEQLDPRTYADLGHTSIMVMNRFVQSIWQRLNDMRSERLMSGGETSVASAMTSSGPVMASLPAPKDASSWSMWGDFFGQFGEQDNKSGVQGYDYDAFGPALGVDKVINDNLIVGASIGYAYTDVDYKVVSGNTSVNAIYTSLYGTYNIIKELYIDGCLAYAHDWYDTSRDIVAVGTAESEHGGDDLSLSTALSYYFKLMKGLHFIPTMSLNYTHHWEEDFTETVNGSPFMNITDLGQDSLSTRLGARLEYVFPMKYGRNRVRIGAGWGHEYLDTQYNPIGKFSQATAGSFTTSGLNADRDSALFNTGWTITLNQHFEASFDYDFDLRDTFGAHNFRGEVRYRF